MAACTDKVNASLRDDARAVLQQKGRGQRMKTPKFESGAGATLALLATRSFVWADLYTFTLALGGTLRYGTADVDIGYGGNVWTHGGPYFDRSDGRATAHWKIGLDVDTWQVTVMPRAVDPVTGTPYPDQIGTQGWIAAARAGALDGAIVLVDRAFLPAWPARPFAGAVTPVGVVNIFTGRMASVDVSRTQLALTINSHLELLNVSMPRNVYRAGCRYTLFDAGCTLAAASFAVAGTAGAGSTQSVILSSAQPPANSSGSFALGRIVMTSGQNTGFSRSVRAWTSGSFTLLSPLPFAVAPGDAFTAYPGCDKQLATCTKFANQANYGGQDFIPAPETAV